MRTRMLMLTLFGIGSLTGCAHTAREYHEAKADYHHERAEDAWRNGHPVKAADEKIKEHQEDDKR